jgi:hypothetical protein
MHFFFFLFFLCVFVVFAKSKGELLGERGKWSLLKGEVCLLGEQREDSECRF